MRRFWPLLIGVGLLLSSVAEAARVTPLVAEDLPDAVGRQGALLLVEFEPGEADPIHRHGAHVFVYVLEGSILMQVEGGPPVTLRPGQTFYEAPADVHVIGRNASSTEPAKFLAFFVKPRSAPFVLPAR